MRQAREIPLESKAPVRRARTLLGQAVPAAIDDAIGVPGAVVQLPVALARPSAVRAERFSFARLAVRVIDITHREPVGHVLLQIAKHRGIFLGDKDCEGPSISRDKSCDEIAVLRPVDVDHCAHVITRSLALSEPSLFDDASVASRKSLYVPAVTKRLFLVMPDWLRYRPSLRKQRSVPRLVPKD